MGCYLSLIYNPKFLSSFKKGFKGRTQVASVDMLLVMFFTETLHLLIPPIVFPTHTHSLVESLRKMKPKNVFVKVDVNMIFP